MEVNKPSQPPGGPGHTGSDVLDGTHTQAPGSGGDGGHDHDDHDHDDHDDSGAGSVCVSVFLTVVSLVVLILC